MCVTNTTHRRTQPVSLGAAQVRVCGSELSQRLLGSLVSAMPVKQPTVESQPVPSFNAEPEYIQAVSQEKQRPKRRRKPQKPGKTAKMNDRHFVVHNYHDHSEDADDFEDVETHDEDANQRRRGGVSVAFPIKLHAVLDQVEADGLGHVISWQAHGRCFVVHKPKEFVEEVMPKYFRQTKLTSFQRQLNLYGFCRLTRGKDAGGYYHELFLRNKVFLCKRMARTKVKGTKFKAASSPDQEPDFYQMPPVTVTPHHSEEELSFHSNESRETMTYQPVVVHQPTIEPYPLQYSTLSQQLSPIQVSLAQAPCSYTGITSQSMAYPPTSSIPSAGFPSYGLNFPLQQPNNADRVLDEAVDELFLNEPSESDNLADFVQDWDPSNTFGEVHNFGEVLQDDSQLGLLLEQFLEE